LLLLAAMTLAGGAAAVLFLGCCGLYLWRRRHALTVAQRG
jgi:hypothetical protein